MAKVLVSGYIDKSPLEDKGTKCKSGSIDPTFYLHSEVRLAANIILQRPIAKLILLHTNRV